LALGTIGGVSSLWPGQQLWQQIERHSVCHYSVTCCPTSDQSP